MYDFLCEHCQGTVRERRFDREALRHKGSFVILEDVPIGVCDTCGARYFDASVLRKCTSMQIIPDGRMIPNTTVWGNGTISTIVIRPDRLAGKPT